jgi:hypothetical protein
MADHKTIQSQIQRIGEIVQHLESSADPGARLVGKELLECVMALHGAALERMLELATEAGEAGEAMIRKCGRDEIVSSVLLLYGLHPESIRTRVTHALENSRKLLERHDAAAELVSISDQDEIILRLQLKSERCSAASLPAQLKAVIQDAAPDASAIVVEESGAHLNANNFVSVARLQHSATFESAPLAEPRHGSAD